MMGMSSATGQQVDGVEHLRQSITDILTTPLGSRVMRRDYGSTLFELIDQPLTRATIVDVYAATVDALARWEPRLRVSRVQAETPTAEGSLSLSIEGEYLPDGTPVRLDGILI